MGTIQTDLINDERYLEAFKGITLYGVAGTNGSGKDTVMELLEQHGFVHFNTSNALRKISSAVFNSTERGGNEAPMGVVGNAFRVAYPGGMVEVGLLEWLIQAAVMPEELRPRGLVIGSIRGTGEAKRLKEMGGKLIVTDADPQLRYERLTGRGRDDDGVSYEEFLAKEQADLAPGETDPTKFGMAAVIDMADIKIVTTSNDLAAFHQKIVKTLGL